MLPFRLRLIFLLLTFATALSLTQAQEANQSPAQNTNAASDRVKKRNQWFYRGRVVRGLSSAELRRRAYQGKLELRRRAYQAKLELRAQYAAHILASPYASLPLSSGSWIPLGPAPLASDASGNGTQDYRQVTGRATAVAIDPADPTGNTVYIGGAQGGVWKSSNAANSVAANVTWAPLTDNQATLSIGAIAIQPGNSDPAKSTILAATGEPSDHTKKIQFIFNEMHCH